MTEETEILIPLTDLTRVSFQCKNCEAEVTIDFSRKNHIAVENEHRKMLCSICSGEFDSQLRGAFSSFLDWREKAIASGHKVYFRIKRGEVK